MDEKKNRFKKGILILRIVFFSGAALMLLLFIALLFSGAGRNIGGAFGIFLSLAIMAYTLFFPSIREKNREIRAAGGKKWFLLRAVHLLTTIFLLYSITVGVFMGVAAHRKAPSSDRPPVVVVLGCLVKNGRPSLLLQERIDTAYEYLSAHPECYCIVTGGKGSDEAMSEARCMYTELVKMGISEERIFMEERSTSTRENLSFSKEIMERENLGDTMLLVTNSWHELRAQMIAKTQGIPCGGEGADTPIWLLPCYYFRELFGVIYQLIF